MNRGKIRLQNSHEYFDFFGITGELFRIFFDLDATFFEEPGMIFAKLADEPEGTSTRGALDRKWSSWNGVGLIQKSRTDEIFDSRPKLRSNNESWLIMLISGKGEFSFSIFCLSEI